MSALWSLVRKDLQVFAADRRAVIVTVLVPLALAAFMGAVTGGGGGGGKIEVVVVDRDESAIARELAAALLADPSFEARAASEEEATERVRAGKASVAVVIPAGFGAAAPRALLAGGDKPTLRLLYDPSEGAELAMARGILMEHGVQIVSRASMSGASGRETLGAILGEVRADARLEPARRQSLETLLSGALELQTATSTGGSGGGLGLPYATAEVPITSSEGARYNAYAHSFAGMTVQFLLFLSIESGGAILSERQRGLWRRLRAAPVSRGTVLASRAISGGLLALAITLVLFAFGGLLFGVRVEGSLAGFACVALAFAATSSSFGLLLATAADTPQAMRGTATFVVLVLTMLGGAWIPAFLFPPWMQTLTRLTPTRWAMDGFDGATWRGLGLEAALAPTVVLLCFAATFAALAWLRFRWEEA